MIKKKINPLLEKTEKKEEPFLKKTTPDKQKNYLEKAGKTTITREMARSLKRIADNMDLLVLLLTVACAIWAGISLGNKEYLEAIFPIILTFFLTLATYVIPKSTFSVAIKDYTKTIIGKKDA